MSQLSVLAEYVMTRQGHRRLAWLGHGIEGPLSALPGARSPSHVLRVSQSTLVM
jgi:hypothetical protein